MLPSTQPEIPIKESKTPIQLTPAYHSAFNSSPHIIRQSNTPYDDAIFGDFHQPLHTVISILFTSPRDNTLLHHASVEDLLYEQYSDTPQNESRSDSGLIVIVAKLRCCGCNALVSKISAWLIYSLEEKDSTTRHIPVHYGAIKILIDYRGARVSLDVDGLDTINKGFTAVANLFRGPVHNFRLFEDGDSTRKLREAAACQPFGSHPMSAVNALKSTSSLTFKTLLTDDGDSTPLGKDDRHPLQKSNNLNIKVW